MSQVHGALNLHCSYIPLKTFEPRRVKTCLSGLRTTKAQTSLCIRALFSTFVICVLESIISKIETSDILIFYLVSVAKETALLETPKTGFLALRPILSRANSSSGFSLY